MIQKGQNIRNHSAWTIGNGDPKHEVCIPHSILAHGNSKGKQEEETDKNNAIVVRKLEERNVGTKGKSTKQDLTSAEDLTIELPEGRESP